MFLGRADVAVAMGLSSLNAPEIQDVVLRVIEAARVAAKPVCASVVDAKDAVRLEQQGVSAFVLSSDQGCVSAWKKDPYGGVIGVQKGL